MNYVKAGLACLGLVLISACGNRSGNANEPSEEFLDAHLSFGDVDDTSMCYRVRQLVFFDQAQGAKGPEWKKIDDGHWELTFQMSDPANPSRSGQMRYLLHKRGEHVQIAEYSDPIFNAPVDVGLTRSFWNAMGMSGMPPVSGCSDPSQIQLKRPKSS